MPRFNPHCRDCPRLAAHLDEVRQDYPTYHAGPVPAFGPARAHLLIVGLAPGLHGANRSGRPFTGDASGKLLFQVLYDTGFASKPEARGVRDGLRLNDCRLTNAVKCLPPGNRPTGPEIRTCAPYLSTEIDTLWQPGIRKPRVLVALGKIAHEAITACIKPEQPLRFTHGARYPLRPRLWLLDSYHPSRQNVNTGRLNQIMLQRVFELARETLDAPARPA